MIGKLLSVLHIFTPIELRYFEEISILSLWANAIEVKNDIKKESIIISEAVLRIHQVAIDRVSVLAKAFCHLGRHHIAIVHLRKTSPYRGRVLSLFRSLHSETEIAFLELGDL